MLMVDDDDDDDMRHDINSDDMRDVHPDLPMGGAVDRLAHLERCDMEAFESIRESFPEFLPPHLR